MSSGRSAAVVASLVLGVAGLTGLGCRGSGGRTPGDGAIDSGDATLADSGVGDGAIDSGDATLADSGATDAGPICLPANGQCAQRRRLPAASLGLAPFGYMGSTIPPCFSDSALDSSAQIAATSSGVYALSTSMGWVLDDPDLLYAPGHTLLFNDGTGWEVVDTELAELSGARDLVATSTGAVLATITACPVQQFLPSPRACIHANAATDDPFVPVRVRAVGDRIFALEATRLVEIIAGVATSFFEFPPVTGVPTDFWTDGNDVIVVGSNQLLLRRISGSAAEVMAAPAGGYQALNVVAVDDFWILSDIIIHYHSATFETRAQPVRACDDLLDPIQDWVRANGETYYVTASVFGRLTVSGFEPIVSLPCSSDLRFTDIAARDGDGHVFMAVVAGTQSGRLCGGAHTLVYDGVVTREF